MTTKPDGTAVAERDPAVRKLAAGLAHDFNNMLLAMTACLELISSRSSEARIVDIAGHGLNTIGRGKALVDRVLALGGIAPQDEQPGNPAPKPASTPRQQTILVIDDDADVRLVLVELLQSLGYRLIEAADGIAGLAGLEQQPDLAIVDCELAGQNGIEIATRLLDRRPGLPIIFATGYSEARSSDPRLSAAPFLRKPFRIADLAKTVIAALEAR
jgi:CheY-like chemotaxis protein